MSARAWWMAAASVAISASAVGAQTIAQRVDAVRDGTVEMTYATRPGVCGDGRGSSWYQGRNGGAYVTSYDGRRNCIPGPMRLTLSRSNGETVTIRTCIACPLHNSDARSLGDVPAREAALYLLSLARQNGSRNSDDAIGGAAMADAGDLSAEFLKLVQDDDATLSAREHAVFWYGESDVSARDLIGLYDSLKPYSLRKQYVFVLSQRHEDQTLDKLIDIARHDRDTEVRKQAMFWLGQTHDPKALQFFKDILVR